MKGIFSIKQHLITSLEFISFGILFMGYLLSKANLDLCFNYFNKQEFMNQGNDSFCVILRPHHLMNKLDYYHNKNNTQEFVMVRTTFKSHKSYFHFFAEKTDGVQMYLFM